MLARREIDKRHGHIQEIIVQDFLAKTGTRMAACPAAAPEHHLWAVAAARLVFAAGMTIQAPPNLSPDGLGLLLAAGIDDCGGVSPVTPEHVDPEAPWPHLRRLAAETLRAGRAPRHPSADGARAVTLGRRGAGPALFGDERRDGLTRCVATRCT